MIYLPNSRHQELAIAGVETLVSTRLDPGVDPIAEADRRGTIMVVLRVGNKDLERPTNGADGVIRQASMTMYDGAQGVFSAPTPIGTSAASSLRTVYLGGMVMAGAGMPGMPGAGPMSWGQPVTGTPIGLPGSTAHSTWWTRQSEVAHSSQSDKNRLPRPVDHVSTTSNTIQAIDCLNLCDTQVHGTTSVYRPGEVFSPGILNAKATYAKQMQKSPRR